ncbi:MAG: hypothetical protein ACR2RB_08085 [Gammaproteobacteria bacterium]
MEHLEDVGEGWEEDPGVTDSPDLVLQCGNDRVACEVSGIGLNDLHQWSNDPNHQLDFDQLDEIVVPREADVWLRNIVRNKNAHIPTYLKNASARDAWLLVHGALTYDIFCFDEDEYDIALLQETAETETHKFDRIYALSPESRNRKVIQVLPKSVDVPPSLAFEPTDGSYLSVTIQTTKSAPPLNAGVRQMRLGSKADRTLTLPPLRAIELKQA